jgi:arsenite methyltransferase
MTVQEEGEIRKAVKERYARLAATTTATASTTTESSCCSSSTDSDCCSSSSLVSLSDVPAEAASINAGCGSPVSLISPKEGDVVVDLGSGGGLDIFRVSPLVGKSGRAIGIDATPEMIWRARETAKKYADKYQNVEFRLGEIEHLPIESNSVDYVISNCVINLSPNKQQVFNEAFRVLKPDGKFVVADMTVNQEIPEGAKNDMGSWSACVSGAISDSGYKTMLRSVGFVDIQMQELSKNEQNSNSEKSVDGDVYPFEVTRSHVMARKPA